MAHMLPTQMGQSLDGQGRGIAAGIRTHANNAKAGPSAATQSGSGKRAITSRACDACRTRKLKCSGRPDVVDINDAGVALVPCQVRRKPLALLSIC